MRQIIIIIALALLSVLPLAGCITDDSPDNTITPLSAELENLKTTVTNHTTKIAKLEEDVAKKADSSRVDNLVTSMGQQSGTFSGYTKAETYSRAEVDAAIASAINALKTNQSWITGTGNTPQGGSDTGTVIFTNNPVSIPQIFSSSSGASSSPWIMTIKNNSSTWQYVKPVVQLNVASGQPSSKVTGITLIISGGSCTMTGLLTTDNITGNMSFSPATMATVATPSIIIMPVSGCNSSGEIQIGPGQSQAVNIQIQNLKTDEPILWNVTTSISSRSM